MIAQCLSRKDCRGFQRRRTAACFLGFLVCAQSFANMEALAPVTAWSLKPSQQPSQSIFKVHYADSGGGVSFRLVMRVDSAERFEVSTFDTFGRKLWDFEVANDRITMLDHKTLEYCASNEGDLINFLALEPLRLKTLPLILFGRLPVPPSTDLELSSSRQTFHDASGQEWSARGEGADPDAWTLWGAERPEIWWTRHGKSGILSRRDGIQIRWEIASLEALSYQIQDLKIPETYERRDCDAADLSQFRQDQPASPNPGEQR